VVAGDHHAADAHLLEPDDGRLRLGPDDVGEGDGPREEASVFDLLGHWHEVHIERVGASGRRLDIVREAPLDEAEGNGLVASVLAAARRAFLVVVEAVERESTADWYGGQPLLAGPGATNAERAERVVARSGGVVRWE